MSASFVTLKGEIVNYLEERKDELDFSGAEWSREGDSLILFFDCCISDDYVPESLWEVVEKLTLEFNTWKYYDSETYSAFMNSIKELTNMITYAQWNLNIDLFDEDECDLDAMPYGYKSYSYTFDRKNGIEKVEEVIMD